MKTMLTMTMLAGNLLAASATAQSAGPAPVANPAPVATPAPAPDYAQDASWLCRPGRADACATNQDVTVIRADGKRSVETFKAGAVPGFDCFYVYPTVSLDRTSNSDMTAGPEEQQVAASQAARFASKCRVFAPLYRQVTITALRAAMTGQPFTGDRALALADVTMAWNDYLKRDNGGRGVVLIGHSQGAGILKQLIASSIETDPAISRRLISAMLIGTNVAVPPGGDVGGDLKTTRLCRTRDQFGCVVSYVTFRKDAPPPANSRFGKVEQTGMVAACTNPAALGGGKVVTDAIFGTKGAGTASATAGPWTSDNVPVTTNFVKTPGLISAECVSADGFAYLAVSVNADAKDPRTDTIVGDVVANGAILKDWGLHLIDMPVAMGDLVSLADRQATAWGRTRRN
ncbi:MAG TPA: DUF3089 domain-containing protein [Sphingomonas sp.]|nr:DUF3089 domain-containing protein [Sphingomonas sp.]